MIPALITLDGSPWEVLPPGIHQASLTEVEEKYAYNDLRRKFFEGLVDALVCLAMNGCRLVYLDGSFVSSKLEPGDYDACWDPQGVDYAGLHPVFRDFDNGRAAQKAMFSGEFFPSSIPNGGSGSTFLEFFQTDRFTGEPKGILAISINSDPMLVKRITP
jgi:hypothetical protein